MWLLIAVGPPLLGGIEDLFDGESLLTAGTAACRRSARPLEREAAPHLPRVGEFHIGLKPLWRLRRDDLIRGTRARCKGWQRRRRRRRGRACRWAMVGGLGGGGGNGGGGGGGEGGDGGGDGGRLTSSQPVLAPVSTAPGGTEASDETHPFHLALGRVVGAARSARAIDERGMGDSEHAHGRRLLVGGGARREPKRQEAIWAPEGGRDVDSKAWRGIVRIGKRLDGRRCGEAMGVARGVHGGAAPPLTAKRELGPPPARRRDLDGRRCVCSRRSGGCRSVLNARRSAATAGCRKLSDTGTLARHGERLTVRAKPLFHSRSSRTRRPAQPWAADPPLARYASMELSGGYGGGRGWRRWPRCRSAGDAGETAGVQMAAPQNLQPRRRRALWPRN